MMTHDAEVSCMVPEHNILQVSAISSSLETAVCLEAVIILLLSH